MGKLAFCNIIGFTITKEHCDQCFKKIVEKGNKLACESRNKLVFDLDEPRVSDEVKKIQDLIKVENEERKKKVEDEKLQNKEGNNS